MSALPGNLDTGRQPPMTVPLRHFFVALGFLLAGIGVGIGQLTGAVSAGGRVAHIHLLLAGWVCVTIMGAMTQFVPVWSGTSLHSRWLANLQLALVTAGLTGFALAFLSGALGWLAVFGVVMLSGFWIFVYNLGRTLATVSAYDVTERHFLFALACFLLLTSLGLTLALNLTEPILAGTPVTHGGVLGAHVTLAVFGAILTTVYGALYQLGTMFTQTELHGVDHYLQSVETLGHPAGVLLLAFGRLADHLLLARIGAGLVLLGAVAVAVVLGRKLVEMQVEWTPMHSRYTVVVVALLAWAVLAVPAWFTDPTARAHLFGGAGTAHLLTLGVVGFVVLGTLYHVVPFIVWVHEYSDLLGLEDVPMIDDLYSDRLAALDFCCLLAGTAGLVASDVLVSDTRLTTVSGVLVTLGVLLFLTNMLLVMHRQSPQSMAVVLVGSLSPGQVDTTDEPSPEETQP